jgi:hypothetical protein
MAADEIPTFRRRLSVRAGLGDVGRNHFGPAFFG